MHENGDHPKRRIDERFDVVGVRIVQQGADGVRRCGKGEDRGADTEFSGDAAVGKIVVFEPDDFRIGLDDVPGDQRGEDVGLVAVRDRDENVETAASQGAVGVGVFDIPGDGKDVDALLQPLQGRFVLVDRITSYNVCYTKLLRGCRRASTSLPSPGISKIPTPTAP